MTASKYVFTLALASGLALGPAVPAGAQATWTLVPSPNVAGSNELLGVAGTGAADAWAVGRVVDFSARPPTSRSQVLRWNGSAWARFPHPSLSGSHQLVDVDVRASDDAWAVGNRQDSTGAGHTLVERWDGIRWSVVPSPNPGTGSNLAGVTTVPSAPDTLWVVGSHGTPGSAIGYAKLILRRTGASWQQFSTPAVTVTDILEAVDASGPTNAWAVGHGFTHPFGGTAVAITVRWDGSRWTNVPVPQPSSTQLFGVKVLAANDVWAVGHTYAGGPFWEPLVLRWDGRTWSRAALPAVPSGGQLRDVVALSPTNVYAIGFEGEGLSARTLVLRWDGRSWTRQPTPSPQTGAKLFAGAAITPGIVWAVGSRFDQALGVNQNLTIRGTGA